MRDCRACLSGLATVVCAALVAGCASSSRPSAELTGRVDRSLARATQYMASRQSADGAWRSGVYGFFKDGPSLTPHVLWAIGALPNTTQVSERGTAYLATLIGAD